MLQSQIAYLVLHIYPFELMSIFVVNFYIHPWSKHISLSLSQVMEHYFIFEIGLFWGRLSYGLVCWFLSKELIFLILWVISIYYAMSCKVMNLCLWCFSFPFEKKKKKKKMPKKGEKKAKKKKKEGNKFE